MRVTLSLPDELARKFQATVPPRQRSQTVARLLESELAKIDQSLADACLAANQDENLNQEIDDWQSFEDEEGLL